MKKIGTLSVILVIVLSIGRLDHHKEIITDIALENVEALANVENTSQKPPYCIDLGKLDCTEGYKAAYIFEYP